MIFCLLSFLILIMQPFSVAWSASRSEAQQVQSEINQLNIELQDAIDKYNQASARLEELNNQIEENQKELERVAKELAKSLRILNKRAAGIYKYGNVYAIEVILGSKSLNDFIQRLNLLVRIGNHDAAIVKQVEAQKKEVEKRAQELAAQREQQAALTRELEARKADLEKRLADKQNVLASILAEIAQIEEQEALRQARKLSSRATRRTGAPLYPPLGDLTYSLFGNVAPGERSDHGTGYGTPGSKPGHNVYIPWGDAYDFMCGDGVVVYAAHNGTVTEAGRGHIIISGDGYTSVYAHIEPFYGVGSYVSAGQPVGVTSGMAHLHFELWVGGDPVMAGDLPNFF